MLAVSKWVVDNPKGHVCKFNGPSFLLSVMQCDESKASVSFHNHTQFKRRRSAIIQLLRAKANRSKIFISMEMIWFCFRDAEMKRKKRLQHKKNNIDKWRELQTCKQNQNKEQSTNIDSSVANTFVEKVMVSRVNQLKADVVHEFSKMISRSNFDFKYCSILILSVGCKSRTQKKLGLGLG